jgi:hypothetical protein
MPLPDGRFRPGTSSSIPLPARGKDRAAPALHQLLHSVPQTRITSDAIGPGYVRKRLVRVVSAKERAAGE